MSLPEIFPVLFVGGILLSLALHLASEYLRSKYLKGYT